MQSEPVQTTKRRLLIVDDEASTRLLLAQVFEMQGYDVASAQDGFAALEQMRLAKPDVILSDLNMPGMSGFELLSVVRRREPGIYVIASSGAYTGDRIPENIPADAFYEKASGMGRLFEVMQRAVASKPLAERSATPMVPVWVTIDERSPQVERPRGERRFAIVCPECLRVSAQVSAKTSGVMHTESCKDCGTTIHYALVEVLAPMSEARYQNELMGSMDLKQA